MTDVAQAADRGGAGGGTAIPRGAWLIAGAHLLLLLAVAGRYGYHRDELYFLEASRHLALGYVDQPPLVALVAWVGDAALGGSVAALRVIPALTSAGTVLLGAVLARELGGGPRARTLSAAALGGAAFVLTVGHLLSTATFDLAFWLAALVVVARLLRTGDARWWLAFGVVSGAALWNKGLVPLLAIAVGVGLLLERRWALLRTPWLPLGALLAVALAAPTLGWQAVNGWPQLEMAAALTDRIGGENRVTLLPLQLVLLGPLLIPVAVAGIRGLWGPLARWRALLWAWPAALLLTLVVGGRPYYPIPLLAAVVIAGLVELEGRPARWLVPALVLNAAGSVVLALPVLAADVIVDTPIVAVNDTHVETQGWPELADQVADVVEALPADERDGVVLLTASYGEAGALDLYGPGLGLPTVYSAHNSYADWRQPEDEAATVVAVRYPRDRLAPLFDDCREVARVDLGPDLDNEVAGTPITICRGLHGGWDQAWAQLRHLS